MNINIKKVEGEVYIHCRLLVTYYRIIHVRGHLRTCTIKIVQGIVRSVDKCMVFNILGSNFT